MIQVRSNVFETNSSSTHSITMCLLSEFERWKVGGVWMLCGGRPSTTWPLLMTDDELWERLQQFGPCHFDREDHDELVEAAHEYGYYKWEDGLPDEMEWFSDTYYPENGEPVVAFGWYGYDG